MKTITQIGPNSLAKISGIFGVFYGLVIGLLLAFFGRIGGSITGVAVPGLEIASIILSPIIYGAVGYVSGYLGAGIYNKLIVPKFGGIEIEIE